MALKRVSGTDRIKELREQRKRKLRIRFLIGVVSVLVIFGSVIFIARTNQLQIQSIVVRGNYIVPAEEVKALVDTIIEQKYAWVIPKSNVLMFPRKALYEKVESTFHRFNTIDFHLENWSTLVVDVTERKNVYLWCDKLPASAPAINQQCYYVDDYGYVFSRSPSFSGNVYFVFYGAYTWNEGESPIGKTLFEEGTYFRDIIRFKEGITNEGLVPHGFVTYPTGVSSFLLSPSLSDAKQKIVFTKNQDLQTLYTNLVLALTSAKLKKQLDEEFNSLAYFDLRYDKKVYYKFGSAPDITAQETALIEPVQQ